jgi:hypothetical protein
MSEPKSNLGYNLKWFTILIITVAIIFTGLFFYISYLRDHQNQSQVNVNIDKTVIVQKVQNLSKLETVDQTLQRDVQIQINSSDLTLFGVTLLQSSRTQKIAATGTVTAGVDLSKISSDDIKVQNGQINISLPSPEILNVNIDEDKTTVLKDDMTLLFKLQDLVNDSTRTQLNDLLEQQVIKQIKAGLVDGACQNDILTTAGENSKSTIINLLKSSGYNDVVVNYAAPQTCSL